ncbi:MAG: hypothetical protein ACHQ4H_04920 [Ktedonobacterales bacterium]
MNQAQDQRILAGELETYLRAMGLPLSLARAATWLSRPVRWQHTYTFAADAPHLHTTLDAWFDGLEGGRLVRSGERQGTFVVQGAELMDGQALGSRSPKLVMATVTIEPEGAGQARVTITTETKVGRFSGGPLERVALAACEMMAGEIAMRLSSAAGH